MLLVNGQKQCSPHAFFGRPRTKNLIVIGCFCMGTTQVDTKYSARNGITVFNSPFSNSRSVAELVIGEIIALARQLSDRSNELHRGTRNKVSSGCWEFRRKFVGIVEFQFKLPNYAHDSKNNRLWQYWFSTVRSRLSIGHVGHNL